MKNITVGVPDEVYRRARIKAAERDTSVSALVREYLERLASRDADFDKWRQRQDEIFETIDSFSADDRLGRDEVHDRALR